MLSLLITGVCGSCKPIYRGRSKSIRGSHIHQPVEWQRAFAHWWCEYQAKSGMEYNGINCHMLYSKSIIHIYTWNIFSQSFMNWTAMASWKYDVNPEETSLHSVGIHPIPDIRWSHHISWYLINQCYTPILIIYINIIYEIIKYWVIVYIYIYNIINRDIIR